MSAPSIKAEAGLIKDEPTLATIIRSAEAIQNTIEERILKMYQEGERELSYHGLDLFMHIHAHEKEYEKQRAAYEDGDRRLPPEVKSISDFRRYYSDTSDMKRRVTSLEEMGLVKLEGMPLPNGSRHGRKKTPFLTDKGWEVITSVRNQLDALAKNLDRSTLRDLIGAVRELEGHDKEEHAYA